MANGSRSNICAAIHTPSGLPGKPYKGIGWLGYLAYILLTASGAYLFFGLFRSKAYN